MVGIKIQINKEMETQTEVELETETKKCFGAGKETDRRKEQ